MSAYDPSISFDSVVVPIPDAPAPITKPNPPASPQDKVIVTTAATAAGWSIYQYGLLAAAVVAALGVATFVYFKFLRK